MKGSSEDSADGLGEPDTREGSDAELSLSKPAGYLRTKDVAVPAGSDIPDALRGTEPVPETKPVPDTKLPKEGMSLMAEKTPWMVIGFAVWMTSALSIAVTYSFVKDTEANVTASTVVVEKYVELEGEEPLALQTGERWETERMAQVRLLAKYDGKMEFRNWDQTRIDILTEYHAIEIDWASKWAEAIGQALYYAQLSGKDPAIILLVKDMDTDRKFIYRCQTICSSHKIKLFIEPAFFRPESVSSIQTDQRQYLESIRNDTELNGGTVTVEESPLSGAALRARLRTLSKPTQGTGVSPGVPASLRQPRQPALPASGSTNVGSSPVGDAGAQPATVEKDGEKGKPAVSGTP